MKYAKSFADLISPSCQFQVEHNNVTKTWPGYQDNFKKAASEVVSFVNFVR